MSARRKWFLSLSLPLIFLSLFYSPAFAAITFTIGNPVTANDETEVEVNLTGLTSTSCLDNRCYLQGTLTTPNLDINQYFGFTQNNDNNWYEYNSSPATTDVIKNTFFHFDTINGSWSGKLKVKNNPTHSNYHGPGQYLLSVRRYSGKSTSSHSESDNFLAVNLSTILPTPTPTPTPMAEPTPSATPRPTATPTPSPSDSNPSSYSISSLIPPSETPIGKVAGISTAKKPKQASFPAELKLSLEFASDSASLSASTSSIILSTLESTNSAKSRFAGQNPSSLSAVMTYGGGALTTLAVAWILVRSYNKGLLWPWLKLPFG